MLTIRGKNIVLRPLYLSEIAEVYDSVLVLATCTPTIKVLQPDIFPHLLRVIACEAKREIPDVTLEEIEMALDRDNITEVLLAISEPRYAGGALIHTESGNA